MKNGIAREKAIEIAAYVESVDRLKFFNGALSEIYCGFWSAPDEEGDIEPEGKETAATFEFAVLRYKHVERNEEDSHIKAFYHILKKFGVSKELCAEASLSEVDTCNGHGFGYFFPIVG